MSPQNIVEIISYKTLMFLMPDFFFVDDMYTFRCEFLYKMIIDIGQPLLLSDNSLVDIRKNSFRAEIFIVLIFRFTAELHNPFEGCHTNTEKLILIV
ncbi:hypothetical protein SDC9_101864 [bioreactor metagenome]|uniref:Uncharacterized protein n=1 Tax=bioreactor metagenome TaxID=1076179 RepID=A0A645APR8_9ZZZZ